MLETESIHALDYTLLRKWQKHLAKHGVQGKTLWNVTGGLSSFLGWLVRKGVLDRVPHVPWPRCDEHVPAIVRPEVQDRLLEAIPGAKRGVFLVTALLRLRHSEACVLDGRDCRNGRLWFRKAGEGRRLDSPLRGTKNRRPRVLPVPEALAEWIDEHVPRERLLGAVHPVKRLLAWTAPMSAFR